MEKLKEGAFYKVGTYFGHKVTLATIKSFIKREMRNNNLYISNKNDFDGMVDCVMPCDDKSFRRATFSDEPSKYNQGIIGAWFVNQSRDYFTDYADNEYIGYKISNCCGSFILAMSRPLQ